MDYALTNPPPNELTNCSKNDPGITLDGPCVVQEIVSGLALSHFSSESL